MKQLVLYVHKIMTHDDKILFRVTCNQKYDPIWADWDENTSEAERPIKLSSNISVLLRTFSEFDTFRILFASEDSFLGSNPFNKTKEEFLDAQKTISNKEIMYWRKLIRGIQNNK